MDHSKTDVPNQVVCDKDTEQEEPLHTHLTGVKVHGRDPGVLCYTWHDRFPAESNVVITILLDTLKRLEEQGPLPPTLNLWFDNCWRENKNKYVLGALHWLVENGVFKKIKLNFLPKGHTHNDVDQLFSIIANRLKYKDIYTLPDLVRECKEVLPSATFLHLSEVASFSTLLEGHLFKGINGHTKPRCFLIKRDQDGVVRHKYRMQVQTEKKKNEDCWMPVNAPGYRVLQTIPDEEKLKRVTKKLCDLEALTKTLDTIRSFLSTDQLKWWEDTLQRFKEEDETGCPTCQKLRMVQKVNARSKHDSDEVKRSKGERCSTAYRQTFAHMEDPSFDHLHPHYETPFNFPDGSSSVFPAPKFRWVNGSYENGEECVGLQLTTEDNEFISELNDLRTEGTPCHRVTGTGVFT